MAIKVTFQQGQTEARATPLHQWDYGQVLEIESSDLPAVFEVHFACPSMNEAIVRSCSAVGGIGTVVIPDRCLEQSNSVIAWAYAIQGTAGTTIKTITIPVVARTRPSRGDEVIPTETTDRYTELISEVNEAVGELTDGNVVAAKAKTATYATSAGTAVTAGDAERAAKAQQAAQADTATQATKATNDSLGDPIHTKYASFKNDFSLYTSGTIILGGTYQIKVFLESGQYLQTIFTTDGSDVSYATLGWANTIAGDLVLYRVGFSDGKFKVEAQPGGTITNYTLYYRLINTN